MDFVSTACGALKTLRYFFFYRAKPIFTTFIRKLRWKNLILFPRALELSRSHYNFLQYFSFAMLFASLGEQFSVGGGWAKEQLLWKVISPVKRVGERWSDNLLYSPLTYQLLFRMPLPSRVRKKSVMPSSHIMSKIEVDQDNRSDTTELTDPSPGNSITSVNSISSLLKEKLMVSPQLYLYFL